VKISGVPIVFIGDVKPALHLLLILRQDWQEPGDPSLDWEMPLAASAHILFRLFPQRPGT